MAHRSYEELPEEIWELILNRLEHDDHSSFESLSIISKRFLSFTNRLRLKFTVLDQTYFIHGTISPLLHRFKHLKTLDLSKLLRLRHVQTALLEIASSSVALYLEALDISNHDSLPINALKELGSTNRKLKVLKCSNLMKLCDEDLIAIAKFQPCLEELDISYPRHKFTIDDEFSHSNPTQLLLTDAGIQVLSTNLKGLIKINISRNHLLTDKSLVALSSNCSSLREVAFLDCSFITINGVQFMLQNSRKLLAVSMSIIQSPQGTLSLFMGLATSGRGLCSLDFRDSQVSNEFLQSIARAQIPLKRIALSSSVGYTVDVLCSFLHAYQSLEFLDLTENNSLSDESLVHISQYLRALISIKLNSCSKLTATTLFTLINSCPFLEDVEMMKTNIGKEDSVLNVTNNPNTNIKSLNLAGNVHLGNECLAKITLTCPNLELLDVSSCLGITGELGEIFKSCCKIRHLSMQDCAAVRNLGLNTELLKLENLFMDRSGLNDEGLMQISKNCNGIVKICLAGCLQVAVTAVKDMVLNCQRLREIDLKGCPNLNALAVDWMVFTRPSLKKIIPPCYVSTTENQRKLLLRHGCQVCEN